MFKRGWPACAESPWTGACVDPRSSKLGLERVSLVLRARSGLDGLRAERQRQQNECLQGQTRMLAPCTACTAQTSSSCCVQQLCHAHLVVGRSRGEPRFELHPIQYQLLKQLLDQVLWVTRASSSTTAVGRLRRAARCVCCVPSNSAPPSHLQLLRQRFLAPLQQRHRAVSLLGCLALRCNTSVSGCAGVRGSA